MAQSLGSAGATSAAIDQALGQAPDVHEPRSAAFVKQANADTLAAIDRAATALSDLRMLVDIVPDNQGLINGQVYAVRDALAGACFARARYLEATGAVVTGVH